MLKNLEEIEEMINVSVGGKRQKSILHIIRLTLEPYKHDTNIGSMCTTALALAHMYFNDRDIGIDHSLVEKDLLHTIGELKSKIQHQQLI